MANTFVNTNIEEFKGVWVFCEQRGGQLLPADFELISEARKLADSLGAEVCGLLLGENVDGIARELGGYGADRIYVCDDPRLSVYTTDAYAKVICDIVMEKKPEILLFGASYIGRDLAPRCAARLHTGLTADCTHLNVDMKSYVEFLKETAGIELDESKLNMNDRTLKMTRPAFGGHLMATITCSRFRPCMSTVRPGVMKKAPFNRAKADSCVVEHLPVSLADSDLRTEVLEVVKSAAEIVDLTAADVIVAVGRGIEKDVEGGMQLAGELVSTFGGGVIAGSRAAVDSGWLSSDRQVGQTGKTVRPKVYVALGISGAIQHVVGMQDAECIIAVNKNEAAPIFQNADYGICGDLYKVVPMLCEAIKAVRAN